MVGGRNYSRGGHNHSRSGLRGWLVSLPIIHVSPHVKKKKKIKIKKIDGDTFGEKPLLEDARVPSS
jgi:hypothetical protein